MKFRSSWSLSLGIVVCLGCSKGATVTPPVGGGLTEAQIEENQLAPTEETFGRPMVVGEEPKK